MHLAWPPTPLALQPFVKKIFEAVNEFEFDSDLDIVALISIEGERIQLDRPVPTAGDVNGVERWLLKAEEQVWMRVGGVGRRVELGGGQGRGALYTLRNTHCVLGEARVWRGVCLTRCEDEPGVCMCVHQVNQVCARQWGTYSASRPG